MGVKHLHHGAFDKELGKYTVPQLQDNTLGKKETLISMTYFLFLLPKLSVINN